MESSHLNIRRRKIPWKADPLSRYTFRPLGVRTPPPAAGKDRAGHSRESDKATRTALRFFPGANILPLSSSRVLVLKLDDKLLDSGRGLIASQNPGWFMSQAVLCVGFFLWRVLLRFLSGEGRFSSELRSLPGEYWKMISLRVYREGR